MGLCVDMYDQYFVATGKHALLKILPTTTVANRGLNLILASSVDSYKRKKLQKYCELFPFWLRHNIPIIQPLYSLALIMNLFDVLLPSFEPVYLLTHNLINHYSLKLQAN